MSFKCLSSKYSSLNTNYLHHHNWQISVIYIYIYIYIYHVYKNNKTSHKTKTTKEEINAITNATVGTFHCSIACDQPLIISAAGSAFLRPREDSRQVGEKLLLISTNYQCKTTANPSSARVPSVLSAETLAPKCL